MDVGHKISPLDFTPEGIIGSLEQRIQDEALMSNIYKQSQGLLTNNEANELNTVLESMGMNEKLNYLGQIYAGAGDKSTELFDQLRVETGSATTSIAGEIVSESHGGLGNAEKLLIGQAYRAANKDEFSNLNKTLPIDILDRVGELYPHNPSRHAAIKEAVYDAYIGHSLEAGKDFMSTNSSILDQAMKTVVGETVKQGGGTIPSLTREMGQREFESYIRNLPDGSFVGLKGVEEERTREEILNGTISMKPVGGGEYLLWREGLPLASSGGGAYRFKYDPTIVPEYRRRIERNPAVEKYIGIN